MHRLVRCGEGVARTGLDVPGVVIAYRWQRSHFYLIHAILTATNQRAL